MELPPINPIDFKRSFADQPPVPVDHEPDPQVKITPSIFPERKYEPWDLSEIETFFQNTVLPDRPIRLNPWSLITNPALFVSSHFEFVRQNNGNPSFRPYFYRILDFRKSLESKSV